MWITAITPRSVSHLASLKSHPNKGRQVSSHAIPCSNTSNSSAIIFHMEEGLLTSARRALQFITASSPSTHLLVPACALYPWTIHCVLSLVFHLLLRLPCNSFSRLPASPGKILMHPLTLLKGPFWFISYLLATVHGMWNLSSLTREQTLNPSTGSAEF